jgi:hypothetical protein
MKKLATIIGMIILYHAPSQADAQKDWVINLDAGVSHDSNINSGLYGSDELDDNSFYVMASGDYFIETSEMSLLTTRVLLESEQYDTFSGLSGLSVGGQLAFSWQNELGFLAPFYRASLEVKLVEAEDHDREGVAYKAQIMGTKRITSKITARAGLVWQDMVADQDAYSVNQKKVFGNVDYMWDGDLTFYGVATYAIGDIATTAQTVACEAGAKANNLVASQSRPLAMNWSGVLDHHVLGEDGETFYLSEIAKSHVDDHVFTEALCGEWTAFKVEADTLSYTLGGNYSLNSNLSVDVSFTGAESKVEDDYKYKRQLVRAGILYQF